MSESVTIFYDNLAEAYRYIFPDWNASVQKQGTVIHHLIESNGFSTNHHTLYDCTCGIGTQTFGLAEHGWRIHATDISSGAIEKAKQYASEFDMSHSPTFAVADLLDTPDNPTQYDIVLSFDNALPHFMTDADLITALQTMRAYLKTDGLLMISIRDYDALIENPPRTTQPSISDAGEGRHIIFQTWDWADDLSCYQLNIYITHHVGDMVTTQCFPSEYRALRCESLTHAMTQVGFNDIQWITLDRSQYYQPIVIARK